jgi:hypothetical protein
MAGEGTEMDLQEKMEPGWLTSGVSQGETYRGFRGLT